MNKTPVPKKNAAHGTDARLPAEPARQWLTAIFALTIFTGAFLLFQVQPLMAKFVLPWFGGSSAEAVKGVMPYHLSFSYMHLEDGRGSAGQHSAS